MKQSVADIVLISPHLGFQAPVRLPSREIQALTVQLRCETLHRHIPNLVIRLPVTIRTSRAMSHGNQCGIQRESQDIEAVRRLRTSIRGRAPFGCKPMAGHWYLQGTDLAQTVSFIRLLIQFLNHCLGNVAHFRPVGLWPLQGLSCIAGRRPSETPIRSLDGTITFMLHVYITSPPPLAPTDSYPWRPLGALLSVGAE